MSMGYSNHEFGVQVSGFVEFLEDRDAVFGGGLDGVQRVDEFLQPGAAFAGGVQPRARRSETTGLRAVGTGWG